jgi:hypothetical protein
MQTGRALQATTLAAGLVLAVLSAALIWFAGVNFDEAFNLQIPASLANGGSYRTTYDGGSRFDPVISTGPTVLLPIWLAFELLGIGIVQARVIALFYFLGMLFTTYYTAKALYGEKSAICSILLILLLPHMFFFGLKILGEIPAFFFFVLACIFLLKQKFFLGGLSFGAAILTKFLFIATIPALLIALLIELMCAPARRRRILKDAMRLAFGLVLPTLTWETGKLALLGMEGYFQNLVGFARLVRASSLAPAGPLYLTLLDRIQTLASPFPHLPIPLALIAVILSMVYSLSQAIKAMRGGAWDPASRVRLFLLAFSILYLAWWLFAPHLGWWRHLFAGYLVILLLVGDALSALLGQASRLVIPTGAPGALTQTLRRAAGALILLAVSYTVFIPPALAQAQRIRSYLYSDELEVQYQVAQTVINIEQTGGRIAYLGWWQSPEISFLSQSQFKNLGRTESRQELDKLSEKGKPVYVLVSPTQMQFAPESWQEEEIYCREAFDQIGEYKLYEYLPIKEQQ